MREIIASDKKIIDIAIKYGYDTPESFSRAFARFHGLSPTEARKSGQIKSFSQLSVKLILTGGDTMDYRIERKEGLKVVCKKNSLQSREMTIRRQKYRRSGRNARQTAL